MNTIGEPLESTSLHAMAVALRVAWSLHGLPYRWGGDDPMAGFDCSGFVIEVFKSIGLLPRVGDWSAQSLFSRFRKQLVALRSGMPGDLVFYGVDRNAIRHVELCLGDGLTMGASGGGRRTLAVSDAARQNAYIKVRPIRLDDACAMVDPFGRKE